jgi:hypothetical protein
MVGLVVAALLGASSPQDSGAKPANGSVAEQTAAFQSAIDKKRFEEALKTSSLLVARYVELGRQLAPKEPPKEPPTSGSLATAKSERKQVTDALEKAVKAPRLPAEFHEKLLAQFDARTEDGDKLLERWLDLSHIHDAPSTLAAGIQALGTYRRLQYIERFEKYTISDQRKPVLIAAAGALGEYFGEKEAIRKRIVGNLILAYSSVGTGFTDKQKQRVLIDEELLLDVRHDFQYALARLTGGVHFNRAKEWVEWWRDAKDAPLRDGVDRPKVQMDGVLPGPAPGSKPGGH